MLWDQEKKKKKKTCHVYFIYNQMWCCIIDGWLLNCLLRSPLILSYREWLIESQGDCSRDTFSVGLKWIGWKTMERWSSRRTVVIGVGICATAAYDTTDAFAGSCQEGFHRMSKMLMCSSDSDFTIWLKSVWVHTSPSTCVRNGYGHALP